MFKWLKNIFSSDSVKLTPQPVEINPSGDKVLHRKAGRLFRLMQSVDKGDARLEVKKEIEYIQSILVFNNYPVPKTTADAEYLFSKLGGN